MWSELRGKWGYKAGASGTPVIPKGAQVVRLVAHASAGGATVAIKGGDALPVISGAAPLDLAFHHLLIVSPNTQDPIVFTGTDSYLVEYVDPTGTA